MTNEGMAYFWRHNLVSIRLTFCFTLGVLSILFEIITYFRIKIYCPYILVSWRALWHCWSHNLISIHFDVMIIGFNISVHWTMLHLFQMKMWQSHKSMITPNYWLGATIFLKRRQIMFWHHLGSKCVPHTDQGVAILGILGIHVPFRDCSNIYFFNPYPIHIYGIY